MTNRTPYPPACDPRAVNLIGYSPPLVYDSHGLYLMSTPNTLGARVACNVEFRERARVVYRIKQDLILSRREPSPWRMALAEATTLGQA